MIKMAIFILCRDRMTSLILLAIDYQLVDGRAEQIRTVQHYPKKTILQLEFSPDAKYLYTGSNDGWLRCWNLLL